MEKQYSFSKVAVGWDLENWEDDKNLDPYKIKDNICSALAGEGYDGPVSIFCYTSKIPQHVETVLSLAGISIRLYPEGEKIKKRAMFIVDMLEWGDQNPVGSYLFISEDDDLTYLVSCLKSSRNYHILFTVSPDSTPGSPFLTTAYPEVAWTRPTLLSGGSPLSKQELLQLREPFKTYIVETDSDTESAVSDVGTDLDRENAVSDVETDSETDSVLESELEYYAFHQAFRRACDAGADKLSVWWNLENGEVCDERNRCKIKHIPYHLYSIFQEKNCFGPLFMFYYGDIYKIPHSLQFYLLLIGKHSNYPTRLNFCHEDMKETIYTKIIVHMLSWAKDNPPPATLFLILDDDRISYVIDHLRRRDYKVHVLQGKDLLAERPKLSILGDSDGVEEASKSGRPVAVAGGPKLSKLGDSSPSSSDSDKLDGVEEASKSGSL